MPCVNNNQKEAKQQLPSAFASPKKNDGATRNAKRVRFWHAPPSHHGQKTSHSRHQTESTMLVPVVMGPEYSTQQQSCLQEWAPPFFPSSNGGYPNHSSEECAYLCCRMNNTDLLNQIYTLQSQVYHWKNYAEGWQRRCDEIASYEHKRAEKAQTDKMVKMKTTIEELQRQKSVLLSRVNRYKEAVKKKPENKKRSSNNHESILLPRCEQSPRPLKKRRFHICTDESPSTPPRCTSPQDLEKGPLMPVCITPSQENTRKFV